MCLQVKSICSFPPGRQLERGSLVVQGSPSPTTVPVTIGTIAPGIFTANSNGQGAPAGQAILVHSDGSRSVQDLSTCGPTPGSCTPNLIPWSDDLQNVAVVLYATGIRKATAFAAQVG